MADVTSLTSPSPGLSATPFLIKSFEFYSPKEPANVKQKILYRSVVLMIDYNRKSFVYKQPIDDRMGILGIDYDQKNS